VRESIEKRHAFGTARQPVTGAFHVRAGEYVTRSGQQRRANPKAGIRRSGLLAAQKGGSDETVCLNGLRPIDSRMY